MYPKASQYSKEQLEACKSVLLELRRVLGNYWEHIAVVGGWVPSLLAQNTAEPHVGTFDQVRGKPRSSLLGRIARTA